MTSIASSCELQGAALRKAHWHMCGIYAIIHRDTKRSYVGSAVKIGRRWGAHISNARGKGRERVHRAIREFGESAFDFVVLELCECSELLEKEKFWIEKMNSASVEGFNTLKNPAERIMGRTVSDVTRARMSASRKGRKRSPECIAAFTATRWTPEAREAARLRMKGRKVSQEVRARLSAAHKGKVISEEVRKKMKIARQRQTFSSETRAKLSASHKGKQFSAEHRAALSAASFRRYSKNQPTFENLLAAAQKTAMETQQTAEAA